MSIKPLKISGVESTKNLSKDKAFWASHVKSFKSSRLTRATYCRMNNLNYYCLGYWVKRLLTKDVSPLIAVKLKPSDAVTAAHKPLLATLNFSNGFRLQIHQQQALEYIVDRFR